LLIGESANRSVVEGIRSLVGSQPSVEHVNEVLTMHMGPDFILVNLSVDFEDQTTAERIESVIGDMDRSIKQRFPQVKRIFIEAEKRKL
jgi:divalent metal cation (Fe/Co/Zn/Cd) transporter